MAVPFFLSLIRAGVETAAASINENNEIDLYSKVSAGDVPGLCTFQFFGGTRKEEPHDLAGGVTITCPKKDSGWDYLQIYRLENMGSEGVNTINDPHIGEFTIKFTKGGPQVQEPLAGTALLDSPWYVTRSGGDSDSVVGLQDIALDPIIMDNCAGNAVDVVVGDYIYSNTGEYAEEEIQYIIVVPALGAEGTCPG
ncbi:hypothetical protein KJ359_006524 [Pestalotiopsis sp. 9143b]|nr:hypothetical protein KJ359_006524 [Pestalotiopsis sp. 9143b]